MLARFEPGARIATHGHGLNEDCVMIDGDLFLGDVLLRKGDYQLAPAGTEHQSLVSDHGATLFFHGAIDTRLHDEA
jgi:anti-sigma factor ChrR (cupin superfamily)